MTAEELTVLQAEIDAIGGGLGPAPVLEKLLEPDPTGDMVVDDAPVLVPKAEIEALLSDASLVAFLDYLATDRATAHRYSTPRSLDLTSPMVRTLVQGLAAGGVITAAEELAVLRLGERRMTRSEKLFGRKLTLEDVKEAYSAQ